MNDEGFGGERDVPVAYRSAIIVVVCVLAVAVLISILTGGV